MHRKRSYKARDIIWLLCRMTNADDLSRMFHHLHTFSSCLRSHEPISSSHSVSSLVKIRRIFPLGP